MRGRPPTGWRAPGAIGLATLPSRSGDQDGRHRIWATDAQIRCEPCPNPGAIFAQFNLTKHILAAAELVPAPLRARSEPRLGAPMPDLSRAGPPVIGETGHVPPDADGPRPLSQVMSGRHERRSTVIATNVGSSGWGAVSGDDRLAAAAIDRKCEASHLRSNAKSYVMRSPGRRARPGRSNAPANFA